MIDILMIIIGIIVLFLIYLFVQEKTVLILLVGMTIATILHYISRNINDLNSSLLYNYISLGIIILTILGVLFEMIFSFFEKMEDRKKHKE